jgi:hypothetical protein
MIPLGILVRHIPGISANALSGQTGRCATGKAAQLLCQSVLELFALLARNGCKGHAALMDVSNGCTINQQAEQLRSTVVAARVHEAFALVDGREIEVGNNFTLTGA